MATTTISTSRNINKTLDYVLSKKAHYNHPQTGAKFRTDEQGLQQVEKNGERVQAVSGVNIPVNKKNAFMAKKMMRDVQKYYQKEVDYVQAYAIVQSFSDEEISTDPKERQQSKQLCNAIGVELARKMYGKNAQVVVVTQCDGKSGLWHNHIISNGVCLDGKSQRGNMRKWNHIAKVNDEVCREFGIKPLDDKNWKSNKTMKRELKEQGKYQSPIEKRMRNQGVNMRKDEVIEQIRTVRDDESIQSFEDFKLILQEQHNIEVLDARSKKNPEELRYSYEYTNKKGLTNTKVSRASTLAGEEFQLTPIKEKIAEKVSKQQEEKEDKGLYYDGGIDDNTDTELSNRIADLYNDVMGKQDEEEFKLDDETEELLKQLEVEVQDNKPRAHQENINDDETEELLKQLEMEVQDNEQRGHQENSNNHEKNTRQHGYNQHHKRIQRTNTTTTERHIERAKSKDDGFELE